MKFKPCKCLGLKDGGFYGLIYALNYTLYDHRVFKWTLNKVAQDHTYRFGYAYRPPALRNYYLALYTPLSWSISSSRFKPFKRNIGNEYSLRSFIIKALSFNTKG